MIWATRSYALDKPPALWHTDTVPKGDPMHLVRCCDTTTQTLQWVDTNTNTVMDTTLAAYASRNIAPTNVAKQLKKLPTIVYKGSASNTQFWAH